MAVFSYLVIDKRGKEIKGTLDAAGREEALSSLRQRGDLVISVNEVGILSRDIKLSIFTKKPTARDLSVFCRQFVSIIDAGVPLASALEMLGEQTENKLLAKAINECKRTIERGETLSHAMDQCPDVFPKMFVTMVEAGEAAGTLDVSFTRMAVQFEKEAKLKETIKKATVYPTIISIVALLAIIVLLTFVVPTFEDMLNQLGVKLPTITSVVLAISGFLQHYWYLVLGGVLIFVFILREYKESSSGRYLFGKLELRLPLFGDLAKKTASARMARTLENLLGSGLPLVDSLSIVSNTMTNIYYKGSLLAAREAVTLGSPLAAQFARDNLFPPLVRHMISIGEETGSIEHMLTKLADYYEEEVEGATERLMAAIEPAIIVVLAVVVGTIIISIMLPMASMYNGISGM
ncbi:MAG: type II secretion system F family protein [Firmicutes bacterium HGW-Firmicutes-16]|nr:MAG: type II secretion system F family protein [Firmicutes bacterium HGW-Firmicutes-16]